MASAVDGLKAEHFCGVFVVRSECGVGDEEYFQDRLVVDDDDRSIKLFL